MNGLTRGVRFEVAQDALGRLMQDRNNLGQIFQSLGSENYDFGYFRLIALGGDGRYGYYPNKGKKRNEWWEYLGTEISSDTEFYYTQGERRDNRDPIAEAGGINLYGYVGGDPLGYSDPLGLIRQGGKTGQ